MIINNKQTNNYAEDKLKSQKEQENIIHFRNSLIPYKHATEKALTAG